MVAAVTVMGRTIPMVTMLRVCLTGVALSLPLTDRVTTPTVTKITAPGALVATVLSMATEVLADAKVWLLSMNSTAKY